MSISGGLKKEKMIKKEDIETERSISEFRSFVTALKSKVSNCKEERYKGVLKKGLYKEFLDEIAPLSLFCIKHYPDNHRITPIIGNQGYDAVVRDIYGNIVDYLEITSPCDGFKEAKNSKLVVEKGIGEIKIYDLGDPFKDLFPFIINSCKRKATKDYSNCCLIINIDFTPPFEKEIPICRSLIIKLEEEIHKIKFRAKKVYLFIAPLNTVRQVHSE